MFKRDTGSELQTQTKWDANKKQDSTLWKLRSEGHWVYLASLAENEGIAGKPALPSLHPHPHPQAPRMFSGNCISTRQDTGGLGENRRIQRKDQQTPALWDSLKINNKTDLRNHPRIKATCSGSLFMKPSTYHHFFRASLLNANRTSIWAISSPKLWIAVFHLLSGVWLFMTPWTAAPQAPLSSTVSRNLLEFMSIEMLWMNIHFSKSWSNLSLASMLYLSSNPVPFLPFPAWLSVAPPLSQALASP